MPMRPEASGSELRRWVASLLVVRASGHLADGQRRYPRWELDNATLKALLAEGLGLLDQVNDAADGWISHDGVAGGSLGSGFGTAAGGPALAIAGGLVDAISTATGSPRALYGWE